MQPRGRRCAIRATRAARMAGVVLALVVLVLAAGAALARGGRPHRITLLRLRRLRALGSAVAAQVGGLLGGLVWGPMYALGLAVSALFVAVFLWHNRRVPGMPLIGLGLLANACAVALNGAMPVSLSAAERAGLDAGDLALAADPQHEPLDAGTQLPALGDVLPLPLPLLPQVVSIGDVLVAAGAGLLMYAGLVGSAARRGTAQPTERVSTVARDSTTRGSYS